MVIAGRPQVVGGLPGRLQPDIRGLLNSTAPSQALSKLVHLPPAAHTRWRRSWRRSCMHKGRWSDDACLDLVRSCIGPSARVRHYHCQNVVRTEREAGCQEEATRGQTTNGRAVEARGPGSAAAGRRSRQRRGAAGGQPQGLVALVGPCPVLCAPDAGGRAGFCGGTTGASGRQHRGSIGSQFQGVVVVVGPGAFLHAPDARGTAGLSAAAAGGSGRQRCGATGRQLEGAVVVVGPSALHALRALRALCAPDARGGAGAARAGALRDAHGRE
mmetsp:Transcript_87812/g.243573  ORF Transcript_87812/g.243573 Transcript_87812/m.243573 type:complete len:272 (-) Transcript_87812:394-1209(-)